MPLTQNQLNQHIVTIVLGAFTAKASLWDLDEDTQALVRLLATRLAAYAAAGGANEREAATTLLTNMATNLKGGALTAPDKHLASTHWQSVVTVA